MLRAVIVDDEKKSRDTLKGLIKRYCKDIEVVAEAGGCEEGVTIINQYEPQVVFLDIQMPDGSGFKLLKRVKKMCFDVIFTTAYDQYAIKAIRFSALDYLLKPVLPGDLVRAVERAALSRVKGDFPQKLDVFVRQYEGDTGLGSRIVLNTTEKMHVVEVDSIVRCMSDDYYTWFYFTDRPSLLVSKTLKEFEQMLGSYGFIRTHKSHLVNISFIESYIKGENGQLLLKEGTKVPVSRRKKERILEILSEL